MSYKDSVKSYKKSIKIIKKIAGTKKYISEIYQMIADVCNKSGDKKTEKEAIKKIGELFLD